MMTGVNPGASCHVTQNNNSIPRSARWSLGWDTTTARSRRISRSPTCSTVAGQPSWATISPFVIEADPASPDFSVRDIVSPQNVSLDAVPRRQHALRKINRFEESVEQVSKNVRSLDTFYEKAYNLMTSRQAKEAFDIHRESDALRERHGMTSLGHVACSRDDWSKAVAASSRSKTAHWDTHRKNTMSLRDLLVPSLDQGVAALLADLDDRGLLESTLVVVTTEFGRTPRINTMAGRDHWPAAFSIVMAGGGVKGGRVVGATDKIGGAVTDRPTTPADMAATVLSVLGIDPATILTTPQGRPIQLVSGGRPVHELM